MKEELTSVIKQRDEVREEIAQFRRDNNIMEMQEIRAMQVRGMHVLCWGVTLGPVLSLCYK